MKTKKLSKKLELNKKTIADLSNSQMGKIKVGGEPTTKTLCGTVCGCVTNDASCTCQTFCEQNTCIYPCMTH